MAQPQVNGEVHNSAFFEHLLRYPVINDGVETFKSNQLGQKSLQLGDSAYRTFAQPVLPYFSKPYQYVSPYVRRVDDLGDKTLSRVDERFPVVTKPTGELYNDAKSLVLLPYHKAFEGRDHFFNTYRSECEKVGGDNLVTYGKALVSTTLVLTTEAYVTVSSFLGAKKDAAKAEANEKVNSN
jgi:hypothetical protein